MNPTMYNTSGAPSPEDDKDKTYGEEESEQEAIDDANEIKAADALGHPDPEDEDLDPTDAELPENEDKDKSE